MITKQMVTHIEHYLAVPLSLVSALIGNTLVL